MLRIFDCSVIYFITLYFLTEIVYVFNVGFVYMCSCALILRSEQSKENKKINYHNIIRMFAILLSGYVKLSKLKSNNHVVWK